MENFRKEIKSIFVSCCIEFKEKNFVLFTKRMVFLIATETVLLPASYYFNFPVFLNVVIVFLLLICFLGIIFEYLIFRLKDKKILSDFKNS